MTMRYSDTPISYTITAGTLSGNTATLTIGTNKAKAGDLAVVSGAGAGYDGTWSIATATSTTISMVVTTASAGAITSGSVGVQRWLARSPLLSDSYSVTLNSITANYIGNTGQATNHTLTQDTVNAGRLYLGWGAPSVTGFPNDGATYDAAPFRYRAYNATAGTYSGEMAHGTTAYTFSGLANATGYWCEVQSRNSYRPTGWVGAGGLLAYTKTVRQYGSIALNAEWSRTYTGTGALRSGDNGYCYHGYYSSSQGQQKAYYGYNWGYNVAGNAIMTRADHYINSQHWHSSAGYTLNVRYMGWSVDLGWAPATGTNGGDTIGNPAWGGRTGVVGYNMDSNKIAVYFRNRSNCILGIHGYDTSISSYGYKMGATQYGTPIYVDWYWDS
jgi:hypothetical protein